MTGSEAGDDGVATPLGREGTHDAGVVHPFGQRAPRGCHHLALADHLTLARLKRDATV
jgi:hypothetical protein